MRSLIRLQRPIGSGRPDLEYTYSALSSGSRVQVLLSGSRISSATTTPPRPACSPFDAPFGSGQYSRAASISRAPADPLPQPQPCASALRPPSLLRPVIEQSDTLRTSTSVDHSDAGEELKAKSSDRVSTFAWVSSNNRSSLHSLVFDVEGDPGPWLEWCCMLGVISSCNQIPNGGAPLLTAAR